MSKEQTVGTRVVKADTVAIPSDPEAAYSAAYLRYTGASQKEAADIVGVHYNTISNWERASWWPQAQQVARDRWLGGLAAKSRKSVEIGVETDPRLAMTVLERLEPALSPKATMQLTGADGGPVEIANLTDEQRRSRIERLLEMAKARD